MLRGLTEGFAGGLTGLRAKDSLSVKACSHSPVCAQAGTANTKHTEDKNKSFFIVEWPPFLATLKDIWFDYYTTRKLKIFKSG